MIRLKTVYSLGIWNIFHVLVYRLKIKTKWYACSHRLLSLQEPFFENVEIRKTLSPSPDWEKNALYFGWWSRDLSFHPPNWHENPMNGVIVPAVTHWYGIQDFDKKVGDIKLVWEASRFGWVLSLSQRVLAGEPEALTQLNEWLQDWIEKNPPYYGVNWKCGQEAAIRVMHLAMVSVLFNQVLQAKTALISLIELHLARIAMTLRYALSQDNNHGTSESAALFIGGSWLVQLGSTKGHKWQKKGRIWLENRVLNLINEDGSFSQHSVNYHRVLLDTLSMVEIWRRKLQLPAFSARYQARIVAAVEWLAVLVDPISGDAPNLGANDGARLGILTNADARDFRPSVQLAMVLFTAQRAYSELGHWDEPLFWFDLKLPDLVKKLEKNFVFDGGGFAVLRLNQVMVFMRYPRFRFRPSHADALHIDLWRHGENLLRDGGTYSYHTEPFWLNYFSGVQSHNTIQFDDRDQMPRLGRFLYGNWLKTDFVSGLQEGEALISFSAAYRGQKGVYHKRSIELSSFKLKVIDEISGFKNNAILRWRLIPAEWQLENSVLFNDQYCLRIQTNVPITRMEIVIGWESRYYLQKTELPVLEVEVERPGMLVTEFEWI